MARDCPELSQGKAVGSRLRAKVRNHEGVIDLAGGVGEDTAGGYRGILNHDLDLSGLNVYGKRNGLCHPAGVVISLLRLPGVSRGATPGYSNGIPPGCAQPKVSESRCGFVPEAEGPSSPPEAEWVQGGALRLSQIPAFTKPRIFGSVV